MQKHNQRSFVPQHDKNKEVKAKYVNTDAAVMSGWKREGNDANIFLSFRFIQHQVQCLFEWEKEEMKSFWAFIEKIHNHTWQMVLGQSGKGQQKAGFGYTIMPRKLYPNDFTNTIDPLVDFFELRITQKARVHCFRHESICYICWLDRNHDYGK